MTEQKLTITIGIRGSDLEVLVTELSQLFEATHVPQISYYSGPHKPMQNNIIFSANPGCLTYKAVSHSHCLMK